MISLCGGEKDEKENENLVIILKEWGWVSVLEG
jgi:hypothetical protein